MNLERLEEFDTLKGREWVQGVCFRNGGLRTREGAAVSDAEVAHCLRRVRKLVQRLQDVFVGKNDLIELMAACAIAQLPLLLLGHWGTGKSMLVRKLAEGLGIQPQAVAIEKEDELLATMLQPGDAWREWVAQHAGDRRHFEYLLTRFTTPEELLGGIHVDAMLKKSVHLRSSFGLLPRAEIAFLDEVFKASTAILNALLALLNERVVHNAGLPWRSNLTMVYAASNEPPQDQDLGAFYDRFAVRAMCDPVEHKDTVLRELIKRSHGFTFEGALGGSDRESLASIRVPRIACVNDFRLLHKVSLARGGGTELSDGSTHCNEFVDTFLRVFMHLRHEYDVSDRSAGHFFRLARARALFRKDGKDNYAALADCIPSKEDVQVLAYCGKVPEIARRLPDLVKELIRL